MRDLIAAFAVGLSASIAQLAQLALPSDPLTWGGAVEKLGIIGLLCVVLYLVLRQWGIEKKEWKESAAQKEVEHKSEMAKKDSKIEALEARLDQAQIQIADLRRHVLQITPADIDVTPTVRRSKLKLEKQEEDNDG